MFGDDVEDVSILFGLALDGDSFNGVIDGRGWESIYHKFARNDTATYVSEG